jgi:prepilin-type N-terminal cleavage/methylation domain-containing protein
MKRIYSGFTLVELMVVVVIVGLMAVAAMPNFYNSRERRLNDQARTILASIRESEKMYRLKNDTNSYASCSSNSNCSIRLGVELSSTDWNFRVTGSGAAYEAMAARIGHGGRVCTANQTAEPFCPDP